MITLIPVPDLEAERAVTSRLFSLRAPLGRRAAPVLDRGGLPERLLAVLRDLSDVDVLPAVELDSWEHAVAASVSQSPAPASARPDALITSPGIDPAVSALAASMCGSRAVSLAGREIEQVARIGARNALLLLNPEVTPADSITSAVQALERGGISWGLLQAADPLDARFVLLKALLVDHVLGTGRIGFMSSAYAPQAEDGAPACLRPSGSAAGREFFEKDRDILFLSGHANALDASIGENLILCARQGRTHGAADLLPCFSDGICFRQPEAGPQHDLLDARRAGGRVLVMSGCNLVSLGRAWFAASNSLVQQALDGPALAIVASSVASVVSFELDLLCLALMAEGLPLGEVVSRLNQVRLDVMQHSTGLPPRIGPLVLMGNPALRVGGLRMERVVGQILDAESDVHRQVRIALRPPEHDRSDGVLLRLEMPPVPHRYIEVEDDEEVFWCRGVQHQTGGQSFLYLWLASTGLEILRLRASSTDPWLPVRSAVDSFWAELFFWTQFLDCYREEVRALGGEAEPLDSAAAELPGLARRLAGLSARMRSPRGVLTSRRTMFRLASAAWREFAPWSDALLLSAVEAVIQTGRVHSYGTSPFYRLAEAADESAACLCSGGLMTGQIFRSPDVRSRRVEYQCGLCGATTDEDGRGLVRLVRCPAATSITQGLSVECECAAPEDAHVHVHAALVLEPWSRGRRAVSQIHRNVLAPGEKTRFELHLDLPSDLSVGSYTISVVAVVNGALYILRRMVQVSRSSEASRAV